MNNPFDIYDDEFEGLMEIKYTFRTFVVQAELNRGKKLTIEDFKDILKWGINIQLLKPRYINFINNEFKYYEEKLFEYEQCF